MYVWDGISGVYLVKSRISATLAIFLTCTLALTAQIAIPVDGFESVGLAHSVLEQRKTGALYLPSVLHGMLESTDDGRTWQAVDSKATFANYKQSSSLFWQDDTTMYARVMDGFGINYQLISTNMGRSWRQRPLHDFPVKAMSVFADGTAIDETRYVVSTDFGIKWKTVKASYDSGAYHFPAILVAPHVIGIWDTRGNWYELDCVKDSALRRRIKDRFVYAYHVFDDGSYIAVATDSWRWYSKEDSLLRKQTDTLMGGRKISLGGSNLITTGKTWTIVTRGGMVFDATTPEMKFFGEPAPIASRTVTSIRVHDNRLIIASKTGSGVSEQYELSEFNATTKYMRMVVRAPQYMIGDLVFLYTITRTGTPIVVTNTANILRNNQASGDWTYCPVKELNVAPVPLTVIGAVPAEGTPGFALVTSTMQPYRITAPGEFVVDSARLPKETFVLRSVGHTLRTTCHRIITTPEFFWRDGYDMTGSSRITLKDTVLCRDCHAYLESKSGLTFSGTQRFLRKHATGKNWDTLAIDTSVSLAKSGYISDIAESTLDNTVVVGLRGYDVRTETARVDSVQGGLWWTSDLGSSWQRSQTSCTLPYIHSLTKVGSVMYAVASNAIFQPQDVGPDKDIGAMVIDSVMILRSTNGGITFDIAHEVTDRRVLHMHDIRVFGHGGRLYTCLQDQRIWVSDDGLRWDEDIDQPQPQGNVLSLTGIGDSVMILSTTKGAYILEKNIQVDVEPPSWKPLNELRYNDFDNSIAIQAGLDEGQLFIYAMDGRLVEEHFVPANTPAVALNDLTTGSFTAVLVTASRTYHTVLGRIR